MTHRYELFHEIAHGPCAAARRFVTDNVPEGVVCFRNVSYPEVELDYRAHGGHVVPALWDGQTLTSGFEDVMTVLRSLARAPT